MVKWSHRTAVVHQYLVSINRTPAANLQHRGQNVLIIIIALNNLLFIYYEAAVICNNVYDEGTHNR